MSVLIWVQTVYKGYKVIVRIGDEYIMNKSENATPDLCAIYIRNDASQ